MDVSPAIFDLAMRRAQWLSAKQSAIAGNIANANTPGFRAREVGKFSAELAQFAPSLATTQHGHMQAIAGDPRGAGEVQLMAQGGEVNASGNDVSTEAEMAEMGQTNTDYALTTNIIRSAHKMVMMALKG